MQDPESYIKHTLNTSPTKQAFTFTKSSRFSFLRRKTSNDSYYELPSTKTRRSCSFGWGNKIDLADKRRVGPPPGSYQLPSDFNKKNSKHNTISFSVGREQVKFGSFIYSAERLKTLPSPNAYRIPENHYSKCGGRMAAKLPSDIDLIKKKKVPGPGTYNLDATEMRSSGSYILTRYRNNLSPKYLSPDNESRSRRSKSPELLLGPGQYEIGADKFGQSATSKFRNSVKNSFSKSKRLGPEDRTKKHFPGFKYKRFSQFGGGHENRIKKQQ